MTTSCLSTLTDYTDAGGQHANITSAAINDADSGHIHYGSKEWSGKPAGERQRNVLHAAASKNNLDLIRKFVHDFSESTVKREVNRQDEAGLTPLHVAFTSGSYEIIELLIRVGADSKLLDDGGHSAAHVAAQSGHFDLMQVLLECTPELVDAQTHNGLTCLHIAAQWDREDMVEWLLKTGADPGALYDNLYTAWDLCCGPRLSRFDAIGAFVLAEQDLRGSPWYYQRTGMILDRSMFFRGRFDPEKDLFFFVSTNKVSISLKEQADLSKTDRELR